MNIVRYEVHEQCFTFNSCRVIHKTDDYDDAKAILKKWQQEHSDRKYFIVDKYLDAYGKLKEEYKNREV